MKLAIRLAAPSEDYQDVIKRSPVGAADSMGVLHQYLTLSNEVYICEADGVIACVWGLVAPTLLSSSAYLWFLHTTLITDHPFLFIRHSQTVIQRHLAIYDMIVGHVEQRNRRAQRWLKWLGAEINPNPVGVFLPFEIRAPWLIQQH